MYVWVLLKRGTENGTESGTEWKISSRLSLKKGIDWPETIYFVSFIYI